MVAEVDQPPSSSPMPPRVRPGGPDTRQPARAAVRLSGAWVMLPVRQPQDPTAREAAMPESRQFFTDRKAAQAARADLIRAGYACQLLPAWALVAIGPVPGARPPGAGEPTAQPAADDGQPWPRLSAV
jgi:hypothetical protein